MWKTFAANGDWAVRFPANDSVVFCLVTQGDCWLRLGDGEPRPLRQGGFLLLAAPAVWTLGAAPGSPTVDFEPPRAGRDHRASFMGDPAQPATHRSLGGRFVFAAPNAHLVAGLVPRVVEVAADDPTAGRLRAALALMDDEAAAERPGRALVLERLLEILLVEAIRRAPPDGPGGPRPGLLAGLADPNLAAALQAMHADMRRPWTVAQLAAMAGLSRSGFAERFARVVGAAPIDYLLAWRMAQARQALRLEAARIPDVAAACGYSSPAAFSTAFRRIVGCSPGRYAAGAGGRLPGPSGIV